MPKEKNEAPKPSNVGSQERTEEIIRMHAYQLFERRGYEHGHDIDDWLQAEAEVMGKKIPESVSLDETETLDALVAV